MASRHSFSDKKRLPGTERIARASKLRAQAAPMEIELVPLEPVAPPPRRRRRLLLLALLALVLFGFSVGVVVGWKNYHSPQARATEVALTRLKDAQREWWETEGLAKEANADPAGAFERLMERQRDWWTSENLAADGNADGTLSLGSLEDMQRVWWERQGLAQGQKPKDPAAVLAQLDEINRHWWKKEKVAKGPVPEAVATGAAPDGADKEYKLSEAKGTRKFLEYGGSEQSELAVQAGLKWLAAQQQPDGRWTPNGKPDGAKGRGNDNSSTALALLPFLAHGITQRNIENNNAYSKHVDSGLKYLMQQQKPDGDLRGSGNMYVHALATIALCEAFVASSDPLLKDSCQKAVDFLVKAQDSKGGGWRYNPGQAGDLSVTSWCLMGLKSGQMAGLHVPSVTLDKAKVFLTRMSRPDGGYNYVAGQGGHSPPTPAVMTAAGIVCRQYLHQTDEDVRSKDMTRGTEIITSNPPNEKNRNFYYYYYGTYALVTVGGEAWQSWNPKVRDLLVSWQEQGDKNPALKGSWDPRQAHQMSAAGRVGVTALALLTLEVYYRHLPLNRPELGEMAKTTEKTPKK